MKIILEVSLGVADRLSKLESESQTKQPAFPFFSFLFNLCCHNWAGHHGISKSSATTPLQCDYLMFMAVQQYDSFE